LFQGREIEMRFLLRGVLLLLVLVSACSGSQEWDEPVSKGQHALAAIEGPGIIGAGPTAIILQSDTFRRAPGSLVQTSSDGSVTSDRVRVLRIAEPRFIGAHRSSENTVKLTLYEMDEPGNITVLATATDTAATVSDFSLARVPVAEYTLIDGEDDMVVVAARTTQDKLRLTLWRVHDGTIDLEDSIDGGDTKLVAVTGVSQALSTLWKQDHGDDVGSLRQMVVATSVPSSGDKLKLIPYLVDTAAKTIVRIGGSGTGVTIDQALSQVDIVALDRPFGVLVTAGRRTDSKLALSTWTVSSTAWTTNATNVIAHASTTVGESVQSVAATTLSHARVGVALRTQDSKHKVSTWDISTSLQLTQRSAATWGSAHGPIAITSANGARLFSISSGRIHSWEAIDALVPLDFVAIPNMSTATSGRMVDIAHLRPDRPVAGYIQADGKRKVVSLQNWDVPLLQGQWPWEGIGSTASTPTPGDDPNLAPRPVPELNVHRSDLAIAVGRKAVVMMDGGGSVVFYDRTGTRLPPKHCLPGPSSCTSSSSFAIPTSVPLSDLFASVLKTTLPAGVPDSGEPNEQSLRYHMSAQKYCDPRLAASSENECGFGFYDGRALYDDLRRRFVLMSGTKAQDHPESAHQAIAVSKTEDPRDGFYVYLTAEGKSGDMPRIGIAGNMLLVGNSVSGSAFSSALHVFNMNALASPTQPQFNHIPSTKIPARAIESDPDDADINPTSQYGQTPYAIVYRRPSGESVKLYAIGPPWGASLYTNGPPTISPAEPIGDVTINVPNGGLSAGHKRGDAFVRMFEDTPPAVVPLPGGGSVFLPGDYSGYFIVTGVHDGDGSTTSRVMRAPFLIQGDEVTGNGSAKVHVVDCGSAKCGKPAAAQNLDRTVMSYLKYSSSLPANATYDLLDSNFAKINTTTLQAAVVPVEEADVDTTAVAPDPLDDTLWVLQFQGPSSSAGQVVLGRVNP
jgi:hypothetical protein